MTYEKFYTISKEVNKMNHDLFCDEELKQFSNDYLFEYELSKKQNKPTHTMIELCKLLLLDMDFEDYFDTLEESENALTIDDMEKIFNDFLENN